MGYYRSLAAIALVKATYAAAYSLSKFYHQELLDYDNYARWVQGPGWFYPIALLAAISAALLHIVGFVAFSFVTPHRIHRVDFLLAVTSMASCLLFCFLLLRWK